MITNHLDVLLKKELIQKDAKVRLHLGCGNTFLPEYVNVDLSPESHNIIDTKANFYSDIRHLNFPPECIDEVRLHHVFEHFDRVWAIALLVRWHIWLKPGGYLRIETPDTLASLKTFMGTSSPWKTKMGIIRHMAGDHATPWGQHCDHWFEDRFKHTLKKLGFQIISITKQAWKKEPYLSNIDIIAIKLDSLPLGKLIINSDILLAESLVSPKEKKLYQIWKDKLREILAKGYIE